jgi:arabinogalactan endo-1,4-beta-galactosidase
MHNIVNRYNKPVVIAEVGMDWTQAATAKAMVSDVITKVKFLGSYGAGVFYWEPEAYPGWQGYTMGATDSGGKFTAAMDAFR